jgi:protein-S-isoprenylcysteine O-methyltransferase Ste14
MRIPPPALALAALLTQRVVSRGRAATSPGRAVAAALIAAGSLALPIAAAREFRRVGTTFDPTHPEQASSLVTSGANAITRNPMYLGLTGLIVANAVRLGTHSSLLPVAAFMAVMDRVQIPSEEAALVQRFGPAYDDYRAAVPRWLDRRSLNLGGR